jgi:hypothetical protein
MICGFGECPGKMSVFNTRKDSTYRALAIREPYKAIIARS